MPARQIVPLLEAMVPEGLRVGGNYLVEFDPSSPWYEASVTIAVRAVERGLKTEYHSFHRDLADVREAMEELGLSIEAETDRGMLRLIGSSAPAPGPERGGRGPKSGFLSGRAPDVGRWGREIKKQTAQGFDERERGWLHIDDNTSLLLQSTDEETMLNSWRTVFIPWGRARELITVNGFVKGIASDTFYRKTESLYDGVFDLVTKEKGGTLEHHIRARAFHGGVIDSRWKTVLLRPRGEVVIGPQRPSEGVRGLAAVMITDMAGYSRLMKTREREAMRLVDAQEGAVRATLPRFEGTLIKGTGDGFLVEFRSALSAVECAVAVQRRMRRVRGGDVIRIGVHVGDVLHQRGDIFGDAVNVAARLQSRAKPGGICLSKEVYEQVSGKIRAPLRYLGTPRLKNIARRVGVYEIPPVPG
ncbi:MAG: adenylate/guanylate cyclase domain-containing protein [Thermoplasmata archaeon]